MRKIALLGALALLSACASSPEAHYFTLSAAPPRQQPPASDRPLFHLAAVKLADLYDRPQMVTRSGAQSIEIDEYDRWAEPLERMTARILAQDIALRRPHPAGPLPVSADQPKLQISVDEFAADRSGTAHLSGNWKITPAGDGEPRGGAFSFTQSVEGSGPASVAAAMSALLGQLADEVDRQN